VEIRPEERPGRGQDGHSGGVADGRRPPGGHRHRPPGADRHRLPGGSGYQPPGGSDPRSEAFVTGGAYALLFVFGAAQGLIGCFQFSQAVGSIPLAALGFCAVILVTCLLGAAAMGSAAGALVPAAGWFLTSLLLTMPTAQGSVIVTNTAAGELYLYGGSGCAALALVIAFARRIGASAARPRGVGHRARGRVSAPGQPPKGSGR
jgi:Family of unknown function (DUF6113)